MNILIKNARVVDCTQDFYGDVYVKNGVIEKTGVDLKENCTVFDGKGMVLLPSFVDLHSHFRDPGLTYKEDLESGSMAAVSGGYTAVNLMANTKPVCSTMDIVEYVKGKSRSIGLVEIHQTVSVTKNLDGRDTTHIEALTDDVKFISDDGRGVMNNSVMYEAMKAAKARGIAVISHAEDEEIVKIDTRLSENIMTLRDIGLAERTGCHLHMAHVSTKEAMQYVVEAKKRGVNITCEVTPHHIGMYNEEDYRVNPPIRRKEDRDFLIQAIIDGWVDAIATDHAPHSEEDKRNGAPGISGIETAFGICFTNLVKSGLVSLSKLSEIMSARPAAILGINKGQIKPGFDGDMVLVNTNNEYRVRARDFMSKGKNTPFDGAVLWGAVNATFKAGNVVYICEEGEHDNR